MVKPTPTPKRNPESIEEAKKYLRKKRLKLRKKKLDALVKDIESGKVDSKKVPVDELFNVRFSPRQEYVSPKDRSSYDYGGYMEIGEMLAGTPNIWR